MSPEYSLADRMSEPQEEAGKSTFTGFMGACHFLWRIHFTSS